MSNTNKRNLILMFAALIAICFAIGVFGASYALAEEQNRFVNESTSADFSVASKGGSAVSGWAYGDSSVTLNIPRCSAGVDTNFRFKLSRNSEWIAGDDSTYLDYMYYSTYVNEDMSSGSYRLELYAPAESGVRAEIHNEYYFAINQIVISDSTGNPTADNYSVTVTGIESWDYGEEIQFNTPRSALGAPTDVKIALRLSTETEWILGGENEFAEMDFQAYFNKWMPAGTYTLRLHLDEKVLDNGVTCPSITNTYTFTVNSYNLRSDIDNVLNGQRFSHQYDGNSFVIDTDAQNRIDSIFNSNAMAYPDSNEQASYYWANAEFEGRYYGGSKLLFGNEVDGTYYELDEYINGEYAPRNIGSYTVYYKVEAPNGSSSGGNNFFTVDIYQAVSVPTFNAEDIVYVDGNTDVVPYQSTADYTVALETSLEEPVNYRTASEYADGQYYKKDKWVYLTLTDNTKRWYIPSELEGDVVLSNDGLTAKVRYSIRRLPNSWTSPLELYGNGWTYGSYDRMVNRFTLSSALPDRRIAFYIMTLENGEYTNVNFGAEDFFRLTVEGYVPEAVITVLNTLNAGTYYVGASVDGGLNYESLAIEPRDYLRITVNPAENSWLSEPRLKGWDYGQFDPSDNLTVGRTLFESSAQTYYAFYTSNNLQSVIVGFEKFTQQDLADETFLAKINGLVDGSYYFKAFCDSDSGNFNNLQTNFIPFQIRALTNRWEKVPSIMAWAEYEWDDENVPSAVALYGNVTLTVIGSNDTVYYSAVYNCETETTTVSVNNLRKALGGKYTLKAVVEANPGKYSALESEVPFQVFLSGSEMPKNNWFADSLPSIPNWTAMDEPGKPQGEALRGDTVFTYYVAKYDETTGRYVKDGDKLDAVPQAPGQYIVRMTVDVEGRPQDHLEAEVFFQIFARVNEWKTIPTIESWELGGTASVPVGEAMSGTVVFTYKLKGYEDSLAVSAKPTKEGTYIMIATATADYCQPLIAYKEFTVSLSQNDWVELPSIKGWSAEDGPNTPVGSAIAGTVVFTYKDLDGKDLDGVPTEEGTYWLHASVTQEGYKPLETDVQFTVTPAYDTALVTLDVILGVVAVLLTISVIIIAIRRYTQC